MPLVTLKRRHEFLRVRGGSRWSCASFVLEAKERNAAVSGPGDTPRFGFTVTKRLGNAVNRNRIRRRLKAALSDVAGTAAKNYHDYVIVARAPAKSTDYQLLVQDFERAFQRVNRTPSRGKSHTRRRGAPRA